MATKTNEKLKSNIIRLPNVPTMELVKQFKEDAKENKAAADKAVRSIQHGAYVLMLLAVKGASGLKDRESNVLDVASLLDGAVGKDVPSPRAIAQAMFGYEKPTEEEKKPGDADNAANFELQVQFTRNCVDLAQRLVKRKTGPQHWDHASQTFKVLLSAFPRKGERLADPDRKMQDYLPLNGTHVQFKNKNNAFITRRTTLAEFLRATAKPGAGSGASKPIVITAKTIDVFASLLNNDKDRAAWMANKENLDSYKSLLAAQAEHTLAEMQFAMEQRTELNKRIVETPVLTARQKDAIAGRDAAKKKGAPIVVAPVTALAPHIKAKRQA